VVEAASSRSRVADVGGSLRLEGSYGDVTVERVTGPVEILAGNGGVTVSDVERDLSIRTAYGTVRVRNVGGGLRVNGASAAISAESVAGAVEVETSYGGVSLRDIGGPVDVRNKSGAVSVSQLYGAALAGAHVVETSYADIDFSWPENSPLGYRLESTYGSIRSHLPGTVHESGSRREMEGSTDGAAARVRLTAVNGSVRLKRD